MQIREITKQDNIAQLLKTFILDDSKVGRDEISQLIEAGLLEYRQRGAITAVSDTGWEMYARLFADERPQLTLDSVVDFTYGFGHLFLLGPINGFYWVWSDPDYSGDDTIRPWIGNPGNFTYKNFCGRDKGTHQIARYCGADVKFIDEPLIQR